MPLPSRLPVSDLTFTLATTFLIAPLTLQIIAIFVFFARAYTRAFPIWKFTIDDYLISLAFALITVMFGLMYEAEAWAWGGNHPAYRSIDDLYHSAKVATIATPFWACVHAPPTSAILRMERIFLYIMIGLNVILILFTGVGNLFQCVPFAGIYDIKNEIKDKKCWGSTMNHASLYISAIINVGTDIIFSLIPLTFLRKIRRPTREKVVIGGLMALGLVASSLSLTKAVMAAKSKSIKDRTAASILFGLLSCLEVQTAFIAACIPTLRSSSKRVLARLGFLSHSKNSAYRRYGEGSIISGGPKGRSKQIKMEHLESEGSRPDADETRDGDDGAYEMDPNTGRIVCTTELQVHSSRTNLREEWQKSPGQVMEEEWEAQRTGVAR
ncbi:hypothetical protein K469DRAFT_754813 [Zopfia rhizophila CBS 207.26]|uniref:Rhodopsin domain-containing protein n=1 Tax=Zopfia rhizophila CBS 207.26 TaxID=1314779 RepID=A0A6A6DHG4_9PEZI|nr:hypothetical protein K469DRAFT_754813 [Zopfia rhizophila CBS 207.26]